MSEETKKYALPSETLPGLRIEDHLSDLLEIRDFLGSRGIRTANTRIDRYCECLRRMVAREGGSATDVFDKQPTETFSDYGEYALYLMREVHELMWILKGLKKFQPLGLDEKLRDVVGGNDFAAMDTNSVSRNTQFELRIASYFCQAGFQVDLSRGTDVVAYDDKVAFYIECKRVASPSQLERRLAEARKQLRDRMPKRAGGRVVYGCVAVDVTKVAFEHNGVTWAMTDDHSRDVIQDKLIAISDRMNNKQLFREAGGLFHYWIQIHMPALIRYPQAMVTRISSYHIFRGEMGKKERRAVARFVDAFESVSKNDERVIPATELAQREEIVIPAGSQFYFDDALIEEFLQEKDLSKRDPESIVGMLKIEESEYEFSFFEFEMAAPNLRREGVAELKSDPVRAGFLMLVEMLYLRQPYKNDPQIQQEEAKVDMS